MRVKLLIAKQSYLLGAILNCRYCTLYGKLDGLVVTYKEQTIQLMELTISYGGDKKIQTYSTLSLFATQSWIQESIATWSKIVLVDSVTGKIGILCLNFCSI